MKGSPLQDVRKRIAEAAAEHRRDPASIRLIAVSKTFDAEAIRPLIEAGQIDFGENRVQEAAGKWPPLLEARRELRLHLIGPLQSNKAGEAVGLFHAIHSIDRDKIAGAIAKEQAKQGRSLELYVQVNTGEEEQKAGIPPTEAAAFVERCRAVHGLLITGLTAIPPVDEAPGPHFALLAKVAKEASIPKLSMGMSNDFETAIAFGATDVRIGRALFGERPLVHEVVQNRV